MTFKFFRKYNKWILAFGISALMVVFLLGEALPMFTQANPDKVIVGTLNGQPITYTQQMNAGFDYEVVSQIASPQDFETLINPRYFFGDESREVFTLFLLEANRLGIHPSTSEAAQTLGALGIDELKLNLFAAQMKRRPEDILHAVQAGLAVQTYIYLANGHVGGKASRLSDPMIQRLAFDMGSTAAASGVIVPVDKAVSHKPAVTDADLTKLFSQYKNDLAGQGKPYGFGYKFPPQVQIEYLSVPGAQITSKIKVDEVELQDYYDKNKYEFVVQQERDPATTQPVAPAFRPYEEVAGTIRENLKRKKADELADKIIRFAANALAADTRSLGDEEGYKLIPAGFKPTPLEKILVQIKDQFGVTPTVIIEGDKWFDAKDLSVLPGIPYSTLPGRQGSSFAAYVMSAKELQPAKDNPYLALRLQVGVASAPLAGFDHSRYIFRLTGAQAAKVPASIDEVKLAVTRDAQKLAALQEVVKDPTAILAKASTKPNMADLAKSFDTTEITLPPFPRKAPSRQSSMSVPYLPGVGQSEAFVDAVFTKAIDLSAKGPIEKAPFKDRLIAVPLENQMAVAIFAVSALKAPSKFEVDMQLANSESALGLQQSLSGQLSPDFFTIKNIQKRLHYVPAKGRENPAAE
jgi:hypothetical protein